MIQRPDDTGKVMHEGTRQMPHYDWTRHEFSDFEKSSRHRTAVEIQADRVGAYCFIDQSGTA